MLVNCTSGERELILHILERELGERAVYHPLPSFAYTVGGYTLLRSGQLHTEERSPEALGVLAALGLCDYPCPAPHPVDGAPEYPIEAHSGGTLMRLFCILSARQQLLNRALRTRNAFFVSRALMEALLAHPPETVPEFLRILYGQEAEYAGVHVCLSSITITGLTPSTPQEAAAYRQLGDLIMAAALRQHWVKPFTPNVRNKKYALRIWLNSIGMLGPEYAETRSILLAHMPGRGDQRRMTPRGEG